MWYVTERLDGIERQPWQEPTVEGYTVSPTARHGELLSLLTLPDVSVAVDEVAVDEILG